MAQTLYDSPDYRGNIYSAVLDRATDKKTVKTIKAWSALIPVSIVTANNGTSECAITIVIKRKEWNIH